MPINNERGSVVIITAVLILALLTIIGISSMKTSITEQQISTNHLIYNMNFYAAESGIAVGPLHAKTAQLDESWDGWPEDGIVGDYELSNGTAFNYTVYKLTDNPDPSLLPNIEIISDGTHIGRGGLARIQGTFRYTRSLSPLSAALTVNGGVAKNNERDVRADDIKGKEIDPEKWDIATTGSLDNIFVENKYEPSAILEDILIFSDNIPAFDGVEFNMPDEDGNDRLCKVVVVPDDGDVDDGCGVLFVDGNTTINGSFSWDGIVVVKEKWKKTGFSGEINGAVVILNESGSKDDLSFIMSAETGYSITWNAAYIKAAQHAISKYRMTSWRQM